MTRPHCAEGVFVVEDRVVLPRWAIVNFISKMSGSISEKSTHLHRSCVTAASSQSMIVVKYLADAKSSSVTQGNNYIWWKFV